MRYFRDSYGDIWPVENPDDSSCKCYGWYDVYAKEFYLLANHYTIEDTDNWGDVQENFEITGEVTDPRIIKLVERAWFLGKI
jgi:hypothetical protein